MRIFVLNWRDIRSPRGGGAEYVTHDVARRLVERGHDVTWLSSAADGLPAEETIDGVRVIRRGSEATTRLHAPLIARRIAHDVVLEEINTLPYLAPLWSRRPVVLYMNQLAREVWWYEAPRVVAAAGWLTEPVYLRAYRRCRAITISVSSRDDLRRLGFRREIWVAPMAPDIEPATGLVPKKRLGALVAIGRLTPSKRYDHMIRALTLLKAEHPAASLTLVGDGRCRAELLQLARELRVAEAVHAVGRVSADDKRRIIDESDILLGSSVREGWGLTVTESAARGVPAVVYDIPGFRDAVIPGRTGLVVEPRPEALAAGAARLLGDPVLYERLRSAARSHVTATTLAPAARAFEAVLTRAAS